ncbi:MAG: 4-(cytidine 5'-diphospho)-2-C-methyl-D-erythritol kinase [Desulfuromonadales bacterium]
MAGYIFQAPAKINICLHVCGRRPDGYHDLGMIMQRISLCDRIEVCLADQPGVRVVCPGLPLGPGEENVAARAAERMLRLSGKGFGVEIGIEKKIPVAAGLGGGSSDAAAVLLALNDMLDLHLGRETLMREAAGIGADVPFFLFRHSAWATGIGDVLTPFPLPSVWYLLVNPGLAVSTAWVYGNFGLTSPGPVAKMPGFPKTAEDLIRLLHNDLESVTISRYPLLAEIKELLLANGAIGALMSGSGPTVFGVFLQEAAARQASASLAAGNPDWRLFVVEPIDNC